MEGSILKQKRKELAEIEDYEPNLARRDVLLVEIETHKTANPGDTVGLDKLYAELKTVREKIRKITGEKQGPKQQPDEIAPEITQPIATPDIKAVKIEKKERKNIDTEQKRIDQIKAELKKPLNSYSAQKLKQHLAVLKNLKHWEGLKTNPDLDIQIQERIADIKKILAKPEIPTKTETKGPEETSPAPETPEGDNIPHEGLVAKEKSIEIFFHLLEQFGFITSDIKTLQDFEEELERTSFMQLGYLRSFLIERKQSYGLGVGHGLEIYIKESLDPIIKKKYMALSDWQRKNDLRNFTNDENLKDFLETLVASEVSVTSEPTPAVIAVSEKAPDAIVTATAIPENKEQVPTKEKLLEKLGMSLDNLQDQNFIQLVELSGALRRLWQNSNAENKKLIDAYLTEVDKYIEQRGIEENMRLSKADYEKIQKECEAVGIRFGEWSILTLQKLQEARRILEEYERRFPGNGEVMIHLGNIDKYISQKNTPEEATGAGVKAPAVEPAPVVENGWTPEKEEALRTLRKEIEDCKSTLGVLKNMKEALPKTIVLGPRDIEQEIEENLTPTLKKKGAVLEGPIIVKFDGGNFVIDIQIKKTVVFKTYHLTITAVVGNLGDSIILKEHSYGGDETAINNAKPDIDPRVKELVLTLTQVIEKKYDRKIRGMQIKNNGLEVALDAKK